MLSGLPLPGWSDYTMEDINNLIDCFAELTLITKYLSLETELISLECCTSLFSRSFLTGSYFSTVHVSLYQCSAIAVPMLCHCCTNAVPLLYQCSAIAVPMLCHCCTNVLTPWILVVTLPLSVINFVVNWCRKLGWNITTRLWRRCTVFFLPSSPVHWIMY